MLDKIKAFFKDAGALIGLIAVAVLGAVFYGMKKKIDAQGSKLGQFEADKNLGEAIHAKEEAENEAMAKENEYKRIRDSFIKQSDEGSGGDTQT